jgi:hypothetical protein
MSEEPAGGEGPGTSGKLDFSALVPVFASVRVIVPSVIASRISSGSPTTNQASRLSFSAIPRSARVGSTPALWSGVDFL